MLRLASDRWVRSLECCRAVCRLPVRKLSLLTAYVTCHTFDDVLYVGSHPILHTVCGIWQRQADLRKDAYEEVLEEPRCTCFASMFLFPCWEKKKV